VEPSNEQPANTTNSLQKFCEGILASGKKCTNRATYGNFCGIHCPKELKAQYAQNTRPEAEEEESEEEDFENEEEENRLLDHEEEINTDQEDDN